MLIHKVEIVRVRLQRAARRAESISREKETINQRLGERGRLVSRPYTTIAPQTLESCTLGPALGKSCAFSFSERRKGLGFAIGSQPGSNLQTVNEHTSSANTARQHRGPNKPAAGRIKTGTGGPPHFAPDMASVHPRLQVSVVRQCREGNGHQINLRARLNLCRP